MALPEGQFSIILYETSDGSCPVQDFLRQLKASNPNDYAAIVAGLSKLRDRKNHRAPLSKAVKEGLFELRHVGKLNTRILWFFQKGRRLIAVHGIRNKAQKIEPRDLAIAKERMKDWIKRHSDD